MTPRTYRGFGVQDVAVLGPLHKLHARIRLDEAADHAGQVERKVLQAGVGGDACRVYERRGASIYQTSANLCW